MRYDSLYTMCLSPHRLPHTTPKPMCDKPSFWMISNDHLKKNFHLFKNQKLFGWYITMTIFHLKSMHLYVGIRFLVSHRELQKPKHFYNLSPLRTMSNHNWQVFHLRGDLSFLTDTQHIFSLPFYPTMRICWTLSYLTKPTQ